MKVEILQNDNSLEHQRQLVAEALPELDSFIIIGHRAPGRGKAPNFASCSFTPDGLTLAIMNFLAAHPQCVEPFGHGVVGFLETATNKETRQ